jgi:prepilin-type N-terminal cleavage/methylation domain-containing protein
MRKVRGFTLVEIIVAIIILGILASIAIPKYLQVRRTAIYAVRDATINSVRTMLVLAYAEKHDFPTVNDITKYLETQNKGDIQQVTAGGTGVLVTVEQTGEKYTVLTFTDEACTAATTSADNKVMCVKGADNVNTIMTNTVGNGTFEDKATKVKI